jgi:hypothetical protein
MTPQSWWATSAATVAAVALGFVFGVEITARLAFEPTLGAMPAWVSTAQLYRTAGIAVFTVGVGAALAIDYQLTSTTGGRDE